MLPARARIAAAALLASGLLATAPALPAQPPREDRPPPRQAPRDAERAPESPADRDALRRRLNNRLEITRLAQQRLEDALRRLDAGETPEQVRDAIAVNPRPDHPSAKDAGLAALLGELSMMERGFPPADDQAAGSPSPDRPTRSAASPNRPGDGRPGDAPTPEQRARAREVLASHRPEMLAFLDEIRATDPELGARTFDRVTMRLRDMASLRDEDPELFDLRLDEMRAAFEVIPNARRLAALTKNASPEAEIDQARRDLRQAMERQFDVRLAIQRHELTRLVERVESLRSQVDRAAADRDSMVDRQMQSVLDRAADVTPIDEKERRPLLERLKKFREVRDRSVHPQGRREPDAPADAPRPPKGDR